jgi:hypothetical protein
MYKNIEIVGLAVMLFGACVVGWQVYEYLRYNIWTPVSVINALQWMEIRWAINPRDWLGLYNILIKIPLSLTMMWVGWLIAKNG